MYVASTYAKVVLGNIRKSVKYIIVIDSQTSLEHVKLNVECSHDVVAYIAVPCPAHTDACQPWGNITIPHSHSYK